jgi:hypothetical protein
MALAFVFRIVGDLLRQFKRERSFVGLQEIRFV